jgi:Zn-dependent protease with chaperone function
VLPLALLVSVAWWAARPCLGGELVPPPSDTALRYHRGGNLLFLLNVGLSLALPALLLWSGLAARLRSLAWRIGRRWYFALVVFLALLAAITFLLELPASFYQGFVREHLYDLSRETAGHWFRQAMGSLVVGLTVMSLVLWVPYLLLRALPRWWWAVTGALVLPFIVLSLLIGPLFVAPLFDRFRPLPDPRLERQILALADRAGVQADRVFEVRKSDETTKINAYVTGVGGTKRIVLWDTLTARLEDREVLFVMAHEIGHYVLGHVKRQILFSWLLVLIGLAFVHQLSRWLLTRSGRQFGFDRLSDFASLPLLVLAATVFAQATSPVALALSRHQEKEADRFALELTRDNAAGASAFAKLQTSNLAIPDPGPLYRIFRASHPPIGDRIRFIAGYRPWKTGTDLHYDHLFR